MRKFEIQKRFELRDEGDQVFIMIDGMGNRYAINSKGLIWDHRKSTHIYPRFVEGKFIVELMFEKTLYKVRLVKLYLMAYSPMHVTFDQYLNQMDVIVYDKDELNVCHRNLNWLIPEGGIETRARSGFYGIVGNPSIVVDKEYNFIYYSSGVSLSKYYPKSDNKTYPSVSYIRKEKLKTPYATFSVHRLIALAFIPLRSDRKALYINHKDGVKNNFNVDNLEWVDPTENALHALTTGLRPENIIIVAINLVTGERREFYSMQECARQLGTLAGLVSLAVDYYKKYGCIKIKPWLIVKKGEEPETYDASLLDKFYPGNPLHYRVIEESTGALTYFYGKKKLRSHLGIAQTNYSYDSSLDSYKEVKINGFKVKLLKYNEIPENIGDYKHKQTYGSKPPIPVNITNLATGEVTHYACTEDFAALVGARKKTIQRRALYNQGVWNNYRLEYLR